MSSVGFSYHLFFKKLLHQTREIGGRHFNLERQHIFLGIEIIILVFLSIKRFFVESLPMTG